MKRTTLFIASALIAFAFSAQAQVGYRSPNPSNFNISYKVAIEPQYDNVALDFSEGMACVLVERGQFHTYIDTTGKPAFDRQFLNIYPFRNGLAAVEAEPNSGKYTYINKAGEDVSDKYTSPRNFSEGYVVVSMDVTGGGHYRSAFMDTFGKIVGHPSFLSANNFSEGYAAVKGKDGSWMVLNNKFKNISGNLPYDDIEEFHEGYARVKIGDKYGFIDTIGHLIIPMQEMWCDTRFSEGLCRVIVDGKYGFMDMGGHIVIPCRFTYAERFSCSRAVVSESAPEESGMIAERGVIDHEGNFVIKEKEYDGILSFSEDYAVVVKDGKYGFINVNGKVVIPMVYDNARSFHEGYAAIKVDGKWGFLKLLEDTPK